MIFALLLVTASFRPAAPTVGDLITIDFEAPVVLERSADYEVVRHEGKRVVVRTFRPEPFELRGRAGDVAFRRLMVPVTSVLRPDDTLQPSPLKPPLPPPRPRAALIAITAAAATAALAWLLVFLLARRVALQAMAPPKLPAAEEFRIAVAALCARGEAAGRWAALADATRAYLSAIEPLLGAELTTAELLRKVGETNIRPQDVIATILRQGDLEKFSPWGARPADFDATAVRALELIPAPIEEAA